MRYKRQGTWHTVTYDGMKRFVEDLAGGLISLGLEPGERVGIYSANTPEWIITDYAALHCAAVTAPVYDTLTVDQAAYILNDAEAKVVFVENEEKLEGVLSKASELEHLEHIVVMGPVPEGYEAKDNILGMDALYTRGRTYLEELPDLLQDRVDSIGPNDLASLVYTSGTTGNPKGVMLTHKNFASNVEATLQGLPIAEETHLAFLPLCHSFARTGDQFVPYSSGSTVCFAEGLDDLAKNMQEVHPTVMLSVPRLYEKMYAKIKQSVDEGSALKQKIFNWSIEVGREVAHKKADGEDIGAGLSFKHKLASKLVFDKLKETTGGKLKFFVSGGAALSPEIMEFFASADLWIMQGYGLTETSPVLTANNPDDYRFGSVGKAIPGVEIRIDEEVWDGSEGEGEIQARGPNITQGYYKLPEETEALFTEDGWLRTGDVGRLDEDGFLFITDRLKQIFKTAYGKYIVPNKLETLLTDQPHIAQAVIIGEDRKYVGALVVPDFERLEPWATEQGLSFETREDLVALDDVHELIWGEVERVNEELARYEQIKRIELLHRELDQENDELTPTLKVKMRVVEDNWADEIEALYPDA